MKKILLALALAALTSPLFAAQDCSNDGTSSEVMPTCTAIDAGTTASAVTSLQSCASGATNCSATVVRKKSLMSVQIFDTLAGTNTVVIDCRSKSATPSAVTVPWYPCYTISNVDATGKFPSLPYANQYRARLTVCTACSVSVLFEREN